MGHTQVPTSLVAAGAFAQAVGDEPVQDTEKYCLLHARQPLIVDLTLGLPGVR